MLLQNVSLDCKFKNGNFIENRRRISKLSFFYSADLPSSSTFGLIRMLVTVLESGQSQVKIDRGPFWNSIFDSSILR